METKEHQGCRMKHNERNRVLINGILMATGSIAILDNVLSHWIFKLHSVLPDETLSHYVEIALFVLGLILFGIGLFREIKDRKTKSE
jgi:uncharacterized membrane protein